MIRNALTAFATRLLGEATMATSSPTEVCRPERVYAARENLGSFAVGFLVGFPQDTEIRLMFAGIRNLIAQVASEDPLDLPERRKTTIDSNFDRMWRMLDGWLLQWECALAARERNIAIPPEFAYLSPPV